MDEACSSNEPFAIDKMNAKLAESTKPMEINSEEETVRLSDYSDSSSDSMEFPYGTRIKPDLLPHINNIIAESEVRRRQFLKKRRIKHGPNSVVEEVMYENDPDDDSAADDNIIVNYTHEAGVYDPIDAMNMIRKKEKVEVASWLLLSSVKGGWNYETVKCFLMRKYRIRSVMSKSESRRLGVLEDANFFQAVVKFQSEAELSRVFNDLVKQKIHDKFIYFTFVDMPVVYYDSDSDEDIPRNGPWNDNPNEVYIFITM